MFTFDFSQSYCLENEQVILRPLQINDIGNLQDFALYEPDIWKFSLVPIHNVADLKAYIEMALAEKETKRNILLLFLIKNNKNMQVQLVFTTFNCKIKVCN